MIKNVTFNKGGAGAKSGRIILPATYLELMKITEEERTVEVTYQDGKIIIEKANK
ncbi:PemI [Clostridium butyricum]|jgi:bifunctional DNA-binding transcriptional regulator/antitoxin component of YhaV-PrlF toxin-antitoxin module|uniref:PemI n=1 Tax=Clostridium butyricum TaxID=1492 RepID=UPI0025859FE4|nr:PemI [Clostridium butyricum]